MAACGPINIQPRSYQFVVCFMSRLCEQEQDQLTSSPALCLVVASDAHRMISGTHLHRWDGIVVVTLFLQGPHKHLGLLSLFAFLRCGMIFGRAIGDKTAYDFSCLPGRMPPSRFSITSLFAFAAGDPSRGLGEGSRSCSFYGGSYGFCAGLGRESFWSQRAIVLLFGLFSLKLPIAGARDPFAVKSPWHHHAVCRQAL